MVLMAAFGFSQADTTEFRMVGLSSGAGNLTYHNSDSTSYTTLNHGYGSGHSIFVNPADEMVYMIVDAGSGDRNLYQVDPFTATSTLVHDFTQTHIHTADLGESGILYCMVGNGATNAAELVTLDLNTMTETNTGFYTTAWDSRAMEYHPGDSALYIYGGYSDSVWMVDLATMTESKLLTSGLNDELHGAFYDEAYDHFFVTSYGASLYLTDNTYSNATYVAGTDTQMDLSLIQLIRGSEAKGYCPGDSVMLSLIYSNTNFTWFKDGVEMTATNDTIYVNTPGVYRAIVSIDNSGLYMWSREITVEEYTVPNVTITAANNDMLICPGESIVLTGVNGQQLQWYMNGSPIVGETGMTYTVTAPGVYNLLKTNLNGCADSSAVSMVIAEDPNCNTGINELNSDKITVYPVPADQFLNITANDKINMVFVTELTGKRVITQKDVNDVNTKINIEKLSEGTYIVEVWTESGVYKKTIMK